MHRLPEATRAAEQALRDRQSGQVDIFGAAGPHESVQMPPDVDEWPLEQRLAGERETLGHYPPAIPPTVGAACLASSPPPPGRDRTALHAAGRASARARRRAASAGRRKPPGPSPARSSACASAARAWRSCRSGLERGRIEASFFREAFVEFGPLLTRDAIPVIEGGLAWDDFSGVFQVRARSAVAAAGLRASGAPGAQVNGIGPDFLAHCAHALAAYRGGTPVRLTGVRYAGGVADFDLGAEWRVRPARTQARPGGIAGRARRGTDPGGLASGGTEAAPHYRRRRPPYARQPAGREAARAVARGLSRYTAPFPGELPRMNLNFLDFEQPIAELEAKIQDPRHASHGQAFNIEDEVGRLQGTSSS